MDGSLAQPSGGIVFSDFPRFTEHCRLPCRRRRANPNTIVWWIARGLPVNARILWHNAHGLCPNPIDSKEISVYSTHRATVTLLAATLLLFLSGAAQALDLISNLTDQLDVTPTQAEGGTGAIFNYAKTQLNPTDFTQVASSVPGVEGYMADAPALGGSSLGGLGGSLSSLTGSSSQLGALAELAGPFGELGLDPEMVSKFVPVVLDYVNSSAGQQTMSLLKDALL